MHGGWLVLLLAQNRREATRLASFDEPRSGLLLAQHAAASRLSRARTPLLHRILPNLAGRQVVFVTDWESHGNRLHVQAANYSGRLRKVSAFELTHRIPAFDIGAAARCLESNVKLALPNTVIVCVVDPGVGSERKAVAVGLGNKSFLVGPHNGVFDLILRCLNRICGIAKVVEIDKNSRYVISATNGAINVVDGDSIFSPVAAAIAVLGRIPKDLGAVVPLGEFGEVLQWSVARKTGEKQVAGRIEEIDPYGTFVTNIPAEILPPLDSGTVLRVENGPESRSIPLVSKFCAVEQGRLLATAHGNTFIHIAANCMRADGILTSFAPGQEITVSWNARG